MENKSLRRSLWNKVVTYVDEHTMAEVALAFAPLVVAGILSGIVLSGDSLPDLYLSILTWHDAAFPKVAGVTLATLAVPRVWPRVREKVLDAIYTLAGEDRTDTIEGIPHVDLLDYLFEHKTFRGDDVEETFGVPRYRVTELTKHLKRVHVLVPGPNNLSVLNPTFTRPDVALVLKGKEHAAELEDWFPEHGGITRSPSRLPPAPGFDTRNVAMSS